MNPDKFNIDDILKDSHKSFQKKAYRPEAGRPAAEERASRPWHQLAAHKNRVLAFLLDFIPISLIVASFYYMFLDFGPILDNYLIGSSDYMTQRAFWEQMRFIQWTTILSWMFYCAILEGSERRATFGKQYMHIQVVDENGGQLSMGRAFGRNASKLFSQFFFYLGYLWSFWDSDRQTWHDKIARTYVIAEEEKQGGFFL